MAKFIMGHYNIINDLRFLTEQDKKNKSQI